jgi:hypothetical protein
MPGAVRRAKIMCNIDDNIIPRREYLGAAESKGTVITSQMGH